METVKVVIKLNKDLYDHVLLTYKYGIGAKAGADLGYAIANGTVQNQGYWKDDPDWRIISVKCSECGHEQDYTSPFCPMCGAKMKMRGDTDGKNNS